MRHQFNELSRRDFLRLAGVSTGVVVAGGIGALSPPVVQAARGGNKPPPARNPLYIPPVVAASSGATLLASATEVDVGGGQLAGAFAYVSGQAPEHTPGPTFIAQQGDTANVTLVNALPQETTVHWHGMIVPHSQDGHPINAVAPGGVRAISFPIVPEQRATLNWYHPHPHTLTGEQVARGLQGGFIIRDSVEDALGLPSGPYEVPLVIRDAKFSAKGDLTFSNRKSGFEGDIALANGTVNAGLEVDRTFYRVRALNGSNARIWRLALSNGAPFRLIGNEGGLLGSAVDVVEIEQSPAERLDLLIDFSGLAAGETVMLQDLNSGWGLVEFVGTGSGGGPGAASSIPSAGAPLSSIGSLGAPVRERNFSFDGMTRINGLVYEMGRVDFEVPRGETELWRFTTGGNAPHPVHIHGEYFQVLSRSGGRGQLYPWEGGWKDTVLLEDGETIEVLIRFDHAFSTVSGVPATPDNPEDEGLYVMHCHKLSHEDAEMMLNFRVVG